MTSNVASVLRLLAFIVFSVCLVPASQAGSTANFRGTTADDIVLQSTDQIAVWPDGSVTGSIILGAKNPAYTATFSGNFDGVGLADLVLCSNVFCAGGAQVVFWGGGSPVNSVFLGTVAAGFQIVGVGDFTGDGIDDLVLFNSRTGLIALWPSGFASGSLVLGTAAPGWEPFAIGNFGLGDPNKAELVLRKFISSPPTPSSRRFPSGPTAIRRLERS